MTYAIGDQVDGYALTARGWVPRTELDPSPFRPGDVVNDAVLTDALRWERLRHHPVPPYRVGDVVEGYVLAPSGDWTPLAERVRQAPSGAATSRQRRAAPTAPAAASPASTHETTTTNPSPRPTPVPSPRPAPRPVQAPVQYRVGQVVNGHVLTPDRGWVPVADLRRASSRAHAPQPARTATRGRPALGFWIFTAFVLVAILRGCLGH